MGKIILDDFINLVLVTAPNPVVSIIVVIILILIVALAGWGQAPPDDCMGIGGCF